MRRHALFLLGLACLPWLHEVARAAGESSLTRGVIGAMAESGSSSRDTRRRAIEAIPFNRMPAAERRLAEQAIERTTLYRRLPTASIACASSAMACSIAPGSGAEAATPVQPAETAPSMVAA